MFPEEISKTPLTTGIARNMFSNITGYEYGNDVSFVSTLRMALYGRIPDESAVNIAYHCCVRPPRRFRADYASSDISNCCGSDLDYPVDGEVRIVYVSNEDPADRDSVMDFINNNFVSAFGDRWAKVQKVTDLFRSSFKCLCFINAEHKTTIMFVDKMSYRIWHLLQSGITAYLPWYLTLRKGEDDEIVELICSTRESKPDKYLGILERFADRIDLRKINIERKLSGIERIVLQKALTSALDTDGMISRRINELYDQITDFLDKKYHNDILIAGSRAKLEEAGDESEIKEYFLNNKFIDLVYTNGSTIQFTVTGVMEYFDEDFLKNALENRRSFVYCYADNGIDSNDVAALFQKIFIDRTFNLRVCAAYEVDIVGRCRGISGHTYDDKTYMPNPHINRFSCLGNYERYILEALMNMDYISAIEQCIASSRSLAFSDSAVMREFMTAIYSNKYKCIELPDGEITNTTGAIAWMKANEEGG